MKKLTVLGLLFSLLTLAASAQDVDVNGQLNTYGAVQIHNTSGRPFLTFKNDDGETPTPASGALISGSAYGGAILLGNNFWYPGVNYHYLKLGMMDNNGDFSSAITIPSETLYVGIGTSNPHEKLSVNGTILAKKVKVSLQTSDWSDYVFAKNYKLRSLYSLEGFISKNKHLPGVPSAKKIEKEGLDVGANQAVLLKKIEELTLYVIELNKTLGAQQKAINTLKAKFKKKK